MNEGTIAHLSNHLFELEASVARVRDMAEGPEVALVTGCTEGGIGHGLALELARRGFRVVATTRSASASTGSSSSSSARPLRHFPLYEHMFLDVCSPQSISDAVLAIVKKYGRIDLLINNAGVPCNTPTAEMPLPLLESTFRTNVYGPAALIQAVVPYMVEAKKGKIVNIGSIGGFAAGPWSGAYAASKAALHALTDSLRVELKPFGIKVILVAPGGVISNIGKRSVSVIQDLDYKIYKPFQEKIYQRASYSQSINSTPTDVFARKTVDALLRKNPPLCFVYGYMSRTYAVLYYMPLWVRDWYFSRKFGLSKAISYEGITKKEI